MSDPLSVLAGVVGIAGFALQSAKKLKEFIDSIQGAPLVVKAISSDLQAVSGVLDSLHKLLDKADARKSPSPVEIELASVLQLPLDNCVAACKNIDDAIKPYVKRSSQNKCNKWSKLTWYWRERDMVDLQGRLMMSKSSLDMAIAVTNISSSTECARYLRNLQPRGLRSWDSLADSSFGGSQVSGKTDVGLPLKRWFMQQDMNTSVDNTSQSIGESPRLSEDLANTPDHAVQAQCSIIGAHQQAFLATGLVPRPNEARLGQSTETALPGDLTQSSNATRQQQLTRTSPMSSLDSFATAFSSFSNVYNQPFSEFVDSLDAQGLRQLRSQAFDQLWKFIPRSHHPISRAGDNDDPGDGIIYDFEMVAKARSTLEYLYQAWLERDPASATFLQKLPSMARLCLVLASIQREALLEVLHDQNLVDGDLPFNRDLADKLFEVHGQDIAVAFCSEQYRAVPRVWERGQHIVLETMEPLPLICDQTNDLKVRDSFSGSYYSHIQVIVNEEINRNDKAEEHFIQELNRFKDFETRHVVQLVKSYQRGNIYGQLLQPPTSSTLERLLDRYRKNRFYAGEGCKDRVWLRPLLLQAFGCLSRDLQYCHNRMMVYEHINPALILFEKASKENGGARFLWAVPDRDNRFERETVEHLGVISYNKPPHSAPGLYKPSRKSNVFSLGRVFREMLDALLNRVPPVGDSADFNVPMQQQLKAWEGGFGQSPELSLLVSMTVNMMSEKASDRPFMDEVVHGFAAAGSSYFCNKCWSEMSCKTIL